MPRPTAAQIVYGSATVVCTTLALLLLTGTESGIGVAVAATIALALGLLVAVRLPRPRQTAQLRAARPGAAQAAARPHHAPDGTGAGQRVPAARSSAGTDRRPGEHTLRR